MLADDALQNCRRDGVIPDSLGIYDGDRSLVANAQAVGFRPIYGIIGFGQAQFFQPFLQVIPRLERLLLRRACGFCLIGTEEDMPADFPDSKVFHQSIETLS